MTLTDLLRAEARQLGDARDQFRQLARLYPEGSPPLQYVTGRAETAEARRNARLRLLAETERAAVLIPAFRRKPSRAGYDNLHRLYTRWFRDQPEALHRAFFPRKPAIPAERPTCSPCARKLLHRLEEELNRHRPAESLVSEDLPKAGASHA
jgi:hypothetical protein